MQLLITNATLVTLNADREIFKSAEMLIDQDRIVQVGRIQRSSRAALRTIDGSGMAVLPGFIHGHLHACQTLFRNTANGYSLLPWLSQRIWPMEAAHTEVSVRASADLTFAELIKTGATGALDMGTVHHTDAIFESAQTCGFRLTGGKAMMDIGHNVPARLQETTQSSMQESVRLAKSWHQAAGGRLRYAFAPRFALSCSKGLLEGVANYALANGLGIHTHASENVEECEAVRAQTGKENVTYLDEVGIRGRHVTLAHGIWLNSRERQQVAQSGTTVCHCPSSNLKLASGIADIPGMLKAKINVSLGADGAACNNNLDIWTEMRLASLIHNLKGGSRSISPEEVLEMATLGGARALNIDDQVGSLAPGKKADFMMVDLRPLHAVPDSGDVVSQLVYSGHSEDVRHVFIDGQWVLRDRVLQTLDEDAVKLEAQVQSKHLIARAFSELR